MNLVSSIAIGINIFDTFTKGAKTEAALINKLWTHSYGVGILAREIWIRCGHNEKEREFAFLCGLLHDLGKVILFKTYPNHYGPIFAISKSETDPVISAYEAENYGMDHSEIGEMLAKQWGFPPELANVIRRHHDPLGLKIPIVRAVTQADFLAKRLGIGYDGDEANYEDVDMLQLKLEISDAEYEHLTEFAARERENIEDFFKISS
jgi:putative nucleotidyltransferase with HDIG domain